MDVVKAVVDRIQRGQPFRVALPRQDLTEVLARVRDAIGKVPILVILPARPNDGDALIDFAGADGRWACDPADLTIVPKHL